MSENEKYVCVANGQGDYDAFCWLDSKPENCWIDNKPTKKEDCEFWEKVLPEEV